MQVLGKFAGQVNRSLLKQTSVHLSQDFVVTSVMKGSPGMIKKTSISS